MTKKRYSIAVLTGPKTGQPLYAVWDSKKQIYVDTEPTRIRAENIMKMLEEAEEHRNKYG